MTTLYNKVPYFKKILASNKRKQKGRGRVSRTSNNTENDEEKKKDRFISELIELLKIPSISADPNYKQDVLNCAEAVAKSMEIAGAENIENFNKKALYIMIREMSGSKTQHITRIVNTMKKYHQNLYGEYLNKGMIDTQSTGSFL